MRENSQLNKNVLKKRDIVYEQARLAQPLRWSKETRNWSFIDEVALNPVKEKRHKKAALEKWAA